MKKLTAEEALVEILDAIGALSNKNELFGRGMDDETVDAVYEAGRRAFEKTRPQRQ